MPMGRPLALVGGVSVGRSRRCARGCLHDATSSSHAPSSRRHVGTGARRGRPRGRHVRLVLHATSRGVSDQRRRSQSFVSPLPPFTSRPTTLHDLGGGVFTLEQPCGFLASGIGQPFPDKALAALTVPGYNVQRCTVVRLLNGGLWVHAPVAPTKQALEMLTSLGGEVQHVVIPCTAPECWYYATEPTPSFVDAFPNATVHAAPSVLFSEEGYIPFAKDVRTPAIERLKRTRAPAVIGTGDGWGLGGQEILSYAWDAGPLYSEVAFLHRKTRTLIVSDSLVGSGEGQLTSPVVRGVVRRRRAAAEDWVETMCTRGGFNRVVTTRGALAPVAATPAQVRDAILGSGG